MKLSLRIPLILTMIVFMTGLITLIKHAARGEAYPTTYLMIWIIGSLVFGGLSFWSWQRNKKN